MFDVWVIQRQVSKNNKILTMDYCEIQLPFAPFVGLYLLEQDNTIETVLWDNGNHRFEVELKSLQSEKTFNNPWIRTYPNV